MDSVNLLTMMFAAPDAVGSPSSTSQQAAPDLGFMLLLQTQLWQNRSPDSLLATEHGDTGLFSAMFTQATGSGETAGLPSTADQVLAGSETTTGSAATQPVAMTPAELFSALLASLRQILQAGVVRLSDSAAATAEVTTTNAATAAPVTTGSSPGSIQVPVAPDNALWQSLPVACLELTSAGQQLVDGWAAIIDRLNVQLGNLQSGAYTAEATGLNVQTALNLNPAMPWSFAVVVDPVDPAAGTLSGSPTVQLTPVASGGYWVPGATEDLVNTGLPVVTELAGETPASIRWFQTAGVMARSVESPATPVATSTPAMIAELQLTDGTTMRLSLQQQAAQPEQSGQVYNLRLEVPGTEATALTATLTVHRLEPAPLAIPAYGALVTADASLIAGTPAGLDHGAVTTVVAGETPLLTAVAVDARQDPVASQSVPVQFQINLPVDNPAVPGASRGVPVAAGNDVGVAQSATLEPTVTLQMQQPGQPTAVAGVIAPTIADGTASIVKPVKTHSGAPTAATRVVQPVHGAPVDDAQAISASKAVALTAAMVDSAAQQLEINAWSADQALDQLKLQATQAELDALGDSPVVRISRSEPVAHSFSQPADVFNQPLPVVNLSAMPAQLMQFVDQPLEFRPYAGLQYLELAERIQQQVNMVRAGSGGFYQARLNLNPPNLGEMFVNISVRGDAVALQLCVVSTVPREQLKDSLEALRQSLEDAGLYVTELRVEQIDADGSGSGGQQQPGEGQARDGDDSRIGTKATSPLAGQSGVAAGTARHVPALGFK